MALARRRRSRGASRPWRWSEAARPGWPARRHASATPARARAPMPRGSCRPPASDPGTDRHGKRRTMAACPEHGENVGSYGRKTLGTGQATAPPRLNRLLAGRAGKPRLAHGRPALGQARGRGARKPLLSLVLPGLGKKAEHQPHRGRFAQLTGRLAGGVSHPTYAVRVGGNPPALRCQTVADRKVARHVAQVHRVIGGGTAELGDRRWPPCDPQRAAVVRADHPRSRSQVERLGSNALQHVLDRPAGRACDIPTLRSASDPHRWAWDSTNPKWTTPTCIQSTRVSASCHASTCSGLPQPPGPLPRAGTGPW